MNRSNPVKPSECSLLADLKSGNQELQTWGHFFNAEGILVNNQGQGSESDRKRCASVMHGTGPRYGIRPAIGNVRKQKKKTASSANVKERKEKL